MKLRIPTWLLVTLVGASFGGCDGCGCSSKETSSSGAAKNPDNEGGAGSLTKSPAATPGVFNATLDGAPLSLHAYAYSRGEGAIGLDLTAKPQSCDRVGVGVGRLPRNEVGAQLLIAPQLQPDGSTEWNISRAYFSGTMRRGKLGSVKMATTDAKAQVRGELDFEIESTALQSDAGRQKLVLRGPVTAQGCGVKQQRFAPEARPQKALKLSIAGKSFSIRDAQLKQLRTGFALELSSSPAGCKLYPDGDVLVTLQLDGEGNPKLVTARGAVLASQLAQAPDEDQVSVELDGPLSGTGDLDVTLRAELKVGDYPLKLEGKAVAARCPIPER